MAILNLNLMDILCSVVILIKFSNVKLNFVVIDVKAKPLLGLQACQELRLIQLIDEVNLYSILNVISKYKKCF